MVVAQLINTPIKAIQRETTSREVVGSFADLITTGPVYDISIKGPQIPGDLKSRDGVHLA